MQPLDPLTLPLHGTRLIEASAGTGKTYTLALLFLRLLLERGLAVDQILVVTFTRAATGELRDRIRARLRQALDHLEQRAQADPLLAALLDPLPPDVCRQRLADTLVRMDEAAIYTIHGFCQRILQEHAFESGAPFDFELLENEQALRLQILEDFWRNRFYGVDPDEAEWAATTWINPAGLLAALGSAATVLDCALIPPLVADETDTLATESCFLFAEVQQAWRQHADEVRTILEEHQCLLRGDKTYRLKDRVPELLTAMDHLASMAEPPWRLPKGIEKLGNTAMANALKAKCAAPPDHPYFTLFDRFYQLHSRLQQDRFIQVLTDAHDYLRTELADRKQVQRWLGHDDLLARLAEALEQPRTGPHLVARIASRYPAALVDEFQDTDPVQYRIFSRIYRRNAGSLLLIGDPKQAIYAFRGADIFTYMQARRETLPDHRATMTVNYRATGAMVRAINALFASRKDSFIFTDNIVFQPIQAAPEPQAQPLLLGEQTVPPLTALLLDSDRLNNKNAATISKQGAKEAAVNFCADLLLHLLEAGKEGKATIGGQPLTAGDIAILVRTHREADAMRDGLRQRGLNCVASSQQSVFASPEAINLVLVLAALEDPSDPGRLRGALATDLFGCRGKELYQLTTDEQVWENRLTSLLRYRQVWHEHGILPMFQSLLATESVTQRLTARTGGQRSLTNYLHLVELLHQSPAGRHGMAALLRWFRQQIDNPDNSAESQLIRLENDEQLLRIVTIHRSKGLEFPVVFLPFLWAGRPAASNGPLTFHDRDSLRLTVDLGTGLETHRRWAEEENLAEELRLLYVALTRAKSCCLFCWGRVKGLERTALAYLLHHGSCPADDTNLAHDLETLNSHEPLLALRPFPVAFGTHRAVVTDETLHLRPALFHGRINPGWTRTSYSRLSAGREVDALAETGDRDDARPPAPEDFNSIFTFPRGPVAGTCLHTLLERLNYDRPAGEQRDLIDQTLLQAGIDPRWQAATVHWLDALTTVPLPGTCALGEIARQDRLHELDFLFPLEQLELGRFNALLIEAGGRPLTAPSSSLHGLMKGFIDLVFRFAGRYYIVDYKSNYLGPDHHHYGHQALADCMDSHQYHLQALIYTLALHRFLGARLPGYHYDDQFGGVYYLFLRAMHPDFPAGTGISFSRPKQRLVAAFDACCRGGHR